VRRHVLGHHGKASLAQQHLLDDQQGRALDHVHRQTPGRREEGRVDAHAHRHAARRQDPGLVDQLAQREPRPTALHRDTGDDGKPLLEQQFRMDISGVCLDERAPEHEVQAAGAQRLHQRVLRALDDLDSRRWRGLLEARQGTRQQHAGDRRRHADAHAQAVPESVLDKIVRDRVDIVQRAPGTCQRDVTLGREGHPAG